MILQHQDKHSSGDMKLGLQYTTNNISVIVDIFPYNRYIIRAVKSRIKSGPGDALPCHHHTGSPQPFFIRHLAWLPRHNAAYSFQTAGFTSQILFEGQRNTSSRGFVAIDDITVRQGVCSTRRKWEPVRSQYTCFLT